MILHRPFLRVALLLSPALLAPTSALAQGPGPGIQPTPISALPFTISSPGSYYLTTNLVGVAGQDGIRINSSNVSLNLNGMRLRGVAGSLSGIKVNGTGRTAITIMNGTIADWGQHGVDATIASHLHVQGVIATGMAGLGLRLGSDSLVLHCQAAGNGSVGISVAGSSSIESCTASGNVGAGIDASQRSRVSRCVADENRGTGIRTSSESTVSECSASFNEGVGFSLDSASTIVGCTAARNWSHGIRVTQFSRVKDCSSFFAGNQNGVVLDPNAAGIVAELHSNTLEGNYTSGNGVAITVLGVGNFVTRNTSQLDVASFQVPPGNSLAPVVSASDLATSTNPAANYKF